MKLKSIDYTEYENEAREWSIDGLEFGEVNLIVGVNSSGKTRALQLVNSLSYLLSRDTKTITPTFRYAARFIDRKQEIRYRLHVKNNRVNEEKLEFGKEALLERKEDGEGSIYAEELKQKIKFRLSDIEIAAYKKRDDLQHPFLEKLYIWATNLKTFNFGSDMGKEGYFDLLFSWRESPLTPEDKIEMLRVNPNVADTIEIGCEQFESFLPSLVKDLAEIGFRINDISVKAGDALSESLKFSMSTKKTKYIAISENGLKAAIPQYNISQGLFRAISLLAHVNLFILMKKASCILIDDIGEGLDFARAAALIRLLIRKAKNTGIQLIMTTNDRFTMNNVPLEYWSIIHRDGNTCKVLNNKNSKRLFEEFHYTGLNNFDFFSSKYYLRNVKDIYNEKNSDLC